MKINFLDLSDLIPQCPNYKQLKEVYDNFVIPKDTVSHEDFLCSLARYKYKKNISAKHIIALCSLHKSKYYLVYKLYLKDTLVYVGSSTSIEARLTKHLEDKRFDYVEVCIVPNKKEMLALEHKLIMDNKPKHNKDCNLKCANSYTGDLSKESFISLEDTNLIVR